MAERASICVFAGSSPGARPEYLAAAQTFGAELARRGHDLVYGGSATGLMGAVADAVLAGGREVCGVIPQFLVDKEVAHTGLSELVVVSSMHERKREMARRASAFVTLPGGLGTLEEFAEVLTWAQLGLHTRPCGILDVAGFYAPLLAFFDHACREGFVRGGHRELIVRASDAAQLLDGLAAHQPVAR
jgi:hypothetical protein